MQTNCGNYLRERANDCYYYMQTRFFILFQYMIVNRGYTDNQQNLTKEELYEVRILV